MPFLSYNGVLANGVGRAGNGPLSSTYDGVLAGRAQRAWERNPPSPTIFLISTQDRLVVNSGLDSEIGNPTPSLKLSFGRYQFRLAVKSGARTVKVDVRQPDATAERPVMRIKANSSIGIPSDVTATAGSQTTWQTISATINPTADGVFILELENPDQAKPCWFDNVKIQ
jgi:hypothetical protein